MLTRPGHHFLPYIPYVPVYVIHVHCIWNQCSLWLYTCITRGNTDFNSLRRCMQTFEDIYIYHTGTSFPLEGSEKCKFNFFRVLVHHSTQYICYISTEQTGDQKSFQFRIMRFSCSQGTFSLFWVQWYRGSLALSCILLLTTCINCHNCWSSHFLPLKIKLYFSMWSLIYN